MDAESWIRTASTFLWVYAAAAAVGWVRAVRGEALRTHVGHFVSLMGVMVPFIALTLFVVFAGGLAGFAFGPILGLLLLPGGLFTAFQLELSRLRPPKEADELRRLALVTVVSALLIAGRA